MSRCKYHGDLPYKVKGCPTCDGQASGSSAAPCSAEAVTAPRLAECLARVIFEMGDEPNSPCTRIQFKGGKWPDNERNQGGIGEEPLRVALEKKLIEWGCPPNGKVSDEPDK